MNIVLIGQYEKVKDADAFYAGTEFDIEAYKAFYELTDVADVALIRDIEAMVKYIPAGEALRVMHLEY